jgi:predicted O-methyltransferase YrrM
MRWLKAATREQPSPGVERRVETSERLVHVDPAVLAVVETAPVWMTPAERLALFTLSFTLRPARYLEIGTLHGGSAMLVAAAMDAVGTQGRLVCLDPNPQIAPENWARIQHRATLLRGFSPHALPEAKAQAGGPFDLVLIDGDHTGAGVLRDATGVLTVAAPGAYVLFHDCFNPDVASGIAEFLRTNGDRVYDGGPLTREITHEPDHVGAPAVWGGMRLAIVR